MASESLSVARSGSSIPFYRDVRVLSVLVQVVFAVVTIAFFAWLLVNMLGNLDTLGITDFQEPLVKVEEVNGQTSYSPWFRFLYSASGFDIQEASFGMAYTRQDTYLDAFSVGIGNTLRVGIIGIILATILGVFTGIARLSNNWLLSKIALTYIEIIRNTPLLVQLFFWFFGALLALPRLRVAGEVTALSLPGSIFLTNRGVALPWLRTTDSFVLWLPFLLIGLIQFQALWVYLSQRELKTGEPAPKARAGIAGFVIIALLGWLVLPQGPLLLDRPSIPESGFNFEGGMVISPQFTAILLGLVVYTGAFIAEIVRAGIQSVSHGQTEASQALGLNRPQTLQLIVLPQALRVIIPPMTSQYLNLVKNSSLATAVAFPDIFQVSGTILNQTGRAVQVIAMIMITYLIFSLIISVFLNWYNKRIQLVER